MVVRLTRSLCSDLGSIEHSVAVVQCGELYRCVPARRAHFVEDHVGPPASQHDVAGPGVDPDGDLVRHDPRGDEDRCFFPDECGVASFERPDRRILPEAIVANDGGGHCLTHGSARSGDGIGAEVDDGVHAPTLPRPGPMQPRLEPRLSP